MTFDQRLQNTSERERMEGGRGEREREKINHGRNRNRVSYGSYMYIPAPHMYIYSRSIHMCRTSRDTQLTNTIVCTHFAVEINPFSSPSFCSSCSSVRASPVDWSPITTHLPSATPLLASCITSGTLAAIHRYLKNLCMNRPTGHMESEVLSNIHFRDISSID